MQIKNELSLTHLSQWLKKIVTTPNIDKNGWKLDYSYVLGSNVKLIPLKNSLGVFKEQFSMQLPCNQSLCSWAFVLER